MYRSTTREIAFLINEKRSLFMKFFRAKRDGEKPTHAFTENIEPLFSLFRGTFAASPALRTQQENIVDTTHATEPAHAATPPEQDETDAPKNPLPDDAVEAAEPLNPNSPANPNLPVNRAGR
jgi:hypothetical protein